MSETALKLHESGSPVCHPAADIFPMYPHSELARLAESIKREGQLDPIELLPDGTLLDGRNRLAACKLAGVEPSFTVVDPDSPVTYVVARNLDGVREMTSAQRDALGVELVAMFAVEAKDRMLAGKADPSPNSGYPSKSADLAADVVGRSSRSIESQKKIHDIAAQLSEHEAWRAAEPKLASDRDPWLAAMPDSIETPNEVVNKARDIEARIKSGDIRTTNAAVTEFNKFLDTTDARHEEAEKRKEKVKRQAEASWQSSSMNKGSVAHTLAQCAALVDGAIAQIAKHADSGGAPLSIAVFDDQLIAIETRVAAVRQAMMGMR